MKKTILFALITAMILYWVTVVSISVFQYDKSTSYNWRGVSYYNNGMTHEGDSCGLIGEKYKLKAEKTLNLLPKFLRP